MPSLFSYGVDQVCSQDTRATVSRLPVPDYFDSEKGCRILHFADSNVSFMLVLREDRVLKLVPGHFTMIRSMTATRLIQNIVARMLLPLVSCLNGYMA